MIPIKKNKEPISFKNAKKKYSDLTYKQFSEEKEFSDAFIKLRESLLKEQNFLCCYCQQKIKLKDEKTEKILMKTEHFIPKRGKEKDESLELNYSNLLAVCLGNSDNEGKKHCDVSKKDKRLLELPSPALIYQYNFNNYIKYEVKEKEKQVIVLAVKGNDNIKQDIEILNLNEQKLREKRYAVWSSIWKMINKNNKINIDRLKEILNGYKEKNKEYCGFILYWFEEHKFKNELNY